MKDRFAGQVYFNIDVLYDGSQKKIIPAGVTEHEKRFFWKSWLVTNIDWLSRQKYIIFLFDSTSRGYEIKEDLCYLERIDFRMNTK